VGVIAWLIAAVLAAGVAPARPHRLPVLRHHGAVAMLTDHEQAVSAVDPRTGRTRQIVRCPARCLFIDRFSWSPDGTRLAYDVVACMNACRPVEPTEGWWLKAAGRTPLHLAPYGFLVWSPDRSELAASLVSPAGTELLVVDPATGAARVLALATGTLLPPAWVDRGRALVYADVTAGAVTLLRVDAGGGTPARIRQFASRPNVFSGAPTAPRDGRRVVVPVFDGHAWMSYVLNADGSHPRAVARDPERADPAEAVWAPDGSAVALGLVFHRHGVRRLEIRVVRADGSRSRTLVDTVKRGGLRLAWSPDGSGIAFSGGSGGWQVVPRAGGTPTRVARLRALSWLQDAPA
jgi:Tol biopolymer transport system component